MSKHTPGPWRVVNAGPHWNNTAIPNYRVVRTPAPSGPNGYDVAWSADGELVVEHVYEEADAHLIAAAPELLEALKGVVRVADRATVEFDAARVAIAKAIGND